MDAHLCMTYTLGVIKESDQQKRQKLHSIAWSVPNKNKNPLFDKYKSCTVIFYMMLQVNHKKQEFIFITDSFLEKKDFQNLYSWQIYYLLSRTFASGLFPLEMQRCKGVLPWKSRIFISAPNCSNNSTING